MFNKKNIKNGIGLVLKRDFISWSGVVLRET